MELLRELPGRRVWRDGDSVVKAFRHPSPWLRWRDAVRARRELAVLRALRERGLPVPEPLAFERIERAACARIAWIHDAPTLEQRLDASELELERARGIGDATARAAIRARRRAWLEATACTLARFTAAGLRQPDWHPKNVLIDAEDRVHVIDLHKARLVRPTATLAQDGARRFASLVFERATPAELARAARAWWEALPSDLRHASGERRALVRRVFAESRDERREQVERDLDRWSRASGAVRVEDGALVARVPDRQGAIDLVRAASEPREARDATEDRDLVLHGDRRAVEHAWVVQARLVEHRIPAARPLRLEDAIDGARAARPRTADGRSSHGSANGDVTNGDLASRDLVNGGVATSDVATSDVANGDVANGDRSAVASAQDASAIGDDRRHGQRTSGGSRATFTLCGARGFAPAGVDPLTLFAERLGTGRRVESILRATRAATRTWIAPDGTAYLVPIDARS